MKEKRYSRIAGAFLRVALFAMAVLPLGFLQTWAQGPFDYTAPIDYSKARITDVGAVVSDVTYYSRLDLETGKEDSVLFISEPTVVWQSENINIYDSTQVDRAMQPRREVRKKALQDDGRWQWGNLMDKIFLSFYYYVFRFEYPSVDAEGNEIMLSGIAACPTPNGASKVNNIIMGTHITITADYQRPSALQTQLLREASWP